MAKLVSQPKRSPRPSPWKSTKVACEELGISRYTLAAMRDAGTLRQGYHWKVKNPRAARLTYLWHCPRIESTQQDVLV